VSGQDYGQAEDPAPAFGPPETGNAAVDDALRGLAGLESTPLDEHHDRLAQAHDALQDALERGDEDTSGGAASG
jgi:hypothetical protein